MGLKEHRFEIPHVNCVSTRQIHFVKSPEKPMTCRQRRIASDDHTIHDQLRSCPTSTHSRLSMLA